MNELLKTLTFVAVALLLTGAAFYETRDRSQKGIPRKIGGGAQLPVSFVPKEKMPVESEKRGKT